VIELHSSDDKELLTRNCLITGTAASRSCNRRCRYWQIAGALAADREELTHIGSVQTARPLPNWRHGYRVCFAGRLAEAVFMAYSFRSHPASARLPHARA